MIWIGLLLDIYVVNGVILAIIGLFEILAFVYGSPVAIRQVFVDAIIKAMTKLACLLCVLTGCYSHSPDFHYAQDLALCATACYITAFFLGLLAWVSAIAWTLLDWFQVIVGVSTDPARTILCALLIADKICSYSTLLALKMLKRQTLWIANN